MRLLELGDGDLLELERGEDIDIIAGVLTDCMPVDAAWRQMEQVKERQRRLTLRTDAARAALANFHDHRRMNPSANLRFRLTTNADVGRERPPSLLHPMSGIDAWNQVRRGGLEPAERTWFLAGIRALLVGARPGNYDEDYWARYQAWVDEADDDALEAFIGGFEWATLAPAPTSFREDVVAKLLEMGYADTSAVAGQQCDRLFARLFHMLAAPGIKQLRRTDVALIIADASADESAVMLFRSVARLDRAIEGVAERVGALEGVLAPFAPWLDRLRGLTDPAADTPTFQHTASFFGPRLDAANTFNHVRPLLGRGELPASIIDAVRTALSARRRIATVVGGAGGVGKSRVLLEVARALEADGVAARWVRDETDVGPSAVVELPDGPVAIFCDDAHRRDDLQVLLTICRERPAATVLVLGVRPWGRTALRSAAVRAGVSFDALLDYGDLPELDTATLITLVKEELGAEDEAYAEVLVRQAQGSTLVSLVGARLLRTRAIAPALLAQDEEFGYTVLTGFQDEMLGRLGDGLDSRLATRTLEYIAAVGPVATDDDEVVDRLAAGIGTGAVELRRTVGALVEAGVLRRDGPQVRIVPDVLADHILHGAIIVGGHPTGFEREVLAHIQSRQLPALVRNLAELQWQLAARGQSANVFAEAWARMLAHFQEALNWERVRLLEAMPRVAAFQPTEMLQLCQWVLENRDRLIDAESTPPRYPGRTWSADSVVQKVPPLLAIIAGHQEHYAHALDLLWDLARADRRFAPQSSEHAGRILADVTAYAPFDHVWRKEMALAALRRWSSESGWSVRGEVALAVATSLLAMSVIQERWSETDNTIRFTRMPIDPAFAAPVRLGVLALLGELAIGPEARGRQLAAKQLLEALKPPRADFGYSVPRAELAGWREQYEATLTWLAKVVESGDDPLVRIVIKDGLGWIGRGTGPVWLAQRARALRNSIEETPGMINARVVAWRFGHHWHAGQSAQAKHAEAMASQVIHALSGDDIEVVIRFLQDQIGATQCAGFEITESPLFERLAMTRSDIAVGLATWVLEPREGMRAYAEWLRPMLIMLRDPQPDAYELLLAAAAHDARAEIRCAAAGVLLVAGQRGITVSEIELTRSLLCDPDRDVRIAMVRGLAGIPGALNATLVPLVDLDGDPKLALAVAQLWAWRPAELQPQLDEAEVIALLSQLEEVPKLDQHEVEKFLAILAGAWPVPVLDFLLARLRRQVASREHLGEAGHVWFDAVPYPGWHAVWDAIGIAPGYQAIVRHLRDVIGTMRDELLDHAIRLIRDLLEWDSEVEAALREWLPNLDIEHARVIGVFLQGLGPAVLEQSDFVADVMAAAGHAGPDVQRLIQSALLSAVSRQHRHNIARHIGEIDALDTQVEATARRMADALPMGSALRELYDTVAIQAAERLAYDLRPRGGPGSFVAPVSSPASPARSTRPVAISQSDQTVLRGPPALPPARP